MPLLGVGIDRRAAVHKRVKKGERALEREALRTDLEDEEGRVTGRLDVERDELGRVQSCFATDLRRVDGDLLPGHKLGCTTRFEEDGTGVGHQRAKASARRAHLISSSLSTWSSSTATA